MKQKDVIAFIKVQGQLDVLFHEMKDLSKKSPNDGVNKFKLKFINNLLGEANKVLDKVSKPFSDFEQFNEDELPTNSDVTIVLSQYLDCLEKFRCENVEPIGYDWKWAIEDGDVIMKTSVPSKFELLGDIDE